VLSTNEAVQLKCPSYNAFDKIVRDLWPTVGQNDLVIIDTLTSLLETTRSDAKLGTDTLTFDLWDRKAKYLEGDKQYLNVYNMAQQFIMRRLINLAAKDARLLVICHTTMAKDPANPLVKITSPDVNPAMIGTLIARSSDVFYLMNVLEDIPAQDGSGQIAVPKDTRVLYLRPEEGRALKYSVDIERSPLVPRLMLNPTLPDVYKILQKKPSWLTLYGDPGAGKTTFAFSEIAPVTPLGVTP
jgi:hypothetical protein